MHQAGDELRFLLQLLALGGRGAAAPVLFVLSGLARREHGA
jgi:hypothetical protein